MQIHVRWAIGRDSAACVLHDADGLGWGDADFRAVLRRRDTVAMVAEVGDSVAGFLVYRLRRQSLSLLRLQVGCSWRGLGVGSALLAKFAYKIAGHRRSRCAVHCGGCWRPRCRRGWLTEPVRLLSQMESPPLFALADALEEADCADRWPLDCLRRGGRFGAAVWRLWSREVPLQETEQ